jgi:hypothetical protein
MLRNVSVLAFTGPSNLSIRLTVPSATLDLIESSICVQPRSALAARICLPLKEINARS